MHADHIELSFQLAAQARARAGFSMAELGPVSEYELAILRAGDPAAFARPGCAYCSTILRVDSRGRCKHCGAGESPAP